MSEVSDLVLDSRLDTRFHERYVYHVYHESDVAKGQRAVQRREFWQRQRLLGSGGFGSVWLEQCVKGEQQGSMRAVKEIQRPRNQFECNRELEAIAKFSHARYARCFARSFGWYEQGSTFYLAMEYFPLGDLQSFLNDAPNPLAEPEVQQITFQILEGLKFMHDNGFAHRDIKPANILVQSRPPQDWWIKISDFGISKRFRDSQGFSTTIKGTLAFMAPELHGIHPPGEEQPILPNATDVWALGEIAHQLLTKRPVFDNVGALYQFVLAIQAFPINKLHQHNVSENAVSLIQQAMSPLPNDRLSADQALQHPWLKLLLPAPSPDLPELELPETLDLLADLDLDEPTARWTTLGSTNPSTTVLARTVRPSDVDQNKNQLAHIEVRQTQKRETQLQPKSLDEEVPLVTPSSYIVEQRGDRAPLESAKHPIDKPRMLYTSMEVEFSVGAWHIPDNGSIAVFGSREGEVIFGNLTEANQEWTYFRTNRRITSIRVNQISSLIACGAQNGEVTIWDMNGELRGRLSTLPVRPITGIGFALSGTTVLIFTEESPPVLWEFGDDFRSPFYTALFRPVSKNQDTDLGLVKKPNRNDRMLDQFAISPDGNLLGIKILSDRTVEFTTVTIIDIRSRRQLAISPFGPDSWATELAFSRDGSVLAYTTRTAVVVWNHVSNRLIGKFSTKYDQYENLTFSPNGKILAAILSGRSIHFWTVEDGVKKVHFQELYQFSRVRNIVFTPDDMLIGVGENWTKSARMCAIYEFPTPIMDGDSAIEKPRQKGNHAQSPDSKRSEGGPHERPPSRTSPPSPTDQATNDSFFAESSYAGSSLTLRNQESYPTTEPINPAFFRPSSWDQQAISNNHKQSSGDSAQIPIYSTPPESTKEFLYRKTVRRFFQISGHIDIISRGRAFSPDGTLYTEAVGASVIVYNIKENGTAKSLPQPPYPANTSNILNRLRKITNNTVPPVPMCIAMSNQNIAVKYRNGLVACWQYGLIESKLVHIESALNTDHMIGVSSRGNFIAYLSNKTMLIRGVGKTNAEIAYHLEMGGVFTRYLPRPSSIAFSPDAGLLAVALTWDTPNEPIKSVHELRIFEVRKNKESSRMVYLSMCDALVFSHDGKLLAFKTDDTLTVWNVYRKRVCFEHTRQRSGQHFLAFSPDSKLLVVVTSGYLSFEIADIATGSFHKIWVHGPSAASMELYGPCTFRQDGSVVAFSHTPGQKGPRSYIDRPRRYTELATAADIEEILSNNLAKQFRSGFTDDFDAFLEVMPGLDVREYTPDPESEVKYEEQLTPGGTRFEISYPA